MKIIFKVGSIICLIGFYLMILLGIFALMEGISRLWAPESAFAKSFGQRLDPIYAYFDIYFKQEPALYQDTGFLTLYYGSLFLAVFTALFFFRYMYKLLKNIYNDSLFMYANVSILLKLGIVIGILGTAATFTENRMVLNVLPELNIINAQVTYSSNSYLDTIVGGIVLILIALALKIAVHAVEENKQTI